MSDARFSKLVEDYYQPLCRFALSLCGEEGAAHDLTQETFLQWARKGHQLRDATKAKTWLFSTLYREFLKNRKRNGRFVQEDLQHLPAAETELESFAENDFAALNSALAQLSQDHRAALTLFYIREHSYHEMAEILKIPVGTIMSRISRAKLALRSRLAKNDDGVFLKPSCQKEKQDDAR